MITLIPLKKVFSAIAGIYALIIVLIIFSFNLTAIDSIFSVLKGVFIVELLIILFVIYWWRKLWSKFPRLNQIVFPDLNGEWAVNINWNLGDKKGSKTAKAFIKQDFFHMSMELVSDKSESVTLIVKPKKDPESSRPILYYIYHNESKQGANPQPSHYGAAFLKLDHSRPGILAGNYFTDRATNGHFELKCINKSCCNFPVIERTDA